MRFHLILTIEHKTDTDYRWVLTDADGRFLDDQEVSLNPADPVYESFQDLPGQLRYQESARPAEAVMAELGAWIEANVFGAAGKKLLAYEQSPACAVQGGCRSKCAKLSRQATKKHSPPPWRSLRRSNSKP